MFSMGGGRQGKIVQILDSPGGEQLLTYRFVVPEALGSDQVRCRAAGVPEFDIPVVRVGFWEEAPQAREEKSPLYSVDLPRDLRSFSLHDARGKLVGRMGPRSRASLLQRRDAAMVNPGIDACYGEWLKHNPVPEYARSLAAEPLPLLSLVVPLFRTPRQYLEELLGSVFSQTYERWELLLVNASPEDAAMAAVLEPIDDPRVHVVPLQKNLGIAGNTNVGIRAATGDLVLFADHDDLLDSQLFAAYAKAWQANPQTDLLYCDEDSFCEVAEGFFGPRFKPDLNGGLLLSHNYVVHCLGVSRYVLDHVELAPDWTSGAQDYDLTLKAWEVARSICHVPSVLYHWRSHPGSTNGGVMETKPYAIEAGRRVIEAHLQRMNAAATVSATSVPCVYDVSYEAPSSALDVVVTYRTPDDVAGFVEALAAVALPADTRVFAVGPELSEGQKTRVEELAAVPVSLVGPQGAWADALAAGVSAGDAPFVLACEAGVRFQDREGVMDLLGDAAQPEVGMVSPRILTLDQSVYSAGTVVTRGGLLRRLDTGFLPAGGGGYNAYAQVATFVSAVGPECFMLRREVWDRCDGLSSAYPGSRLVTAADLGFRVRAQALNVLADNSVDVEARDLAFGPIGFYRRDDSYALSPFWRAWPQKAWGADVLGNPNTEMAEGYPHLLLDW